MLDPIPLSALEHFAYCERQCALIHLEQFWDDNVLTERGNQSHQRADRPQGSERGVKFAVPLWSDHHGLIGRADAVQMSPSVMPIEYKAGTLRAWGAEDIQLCGQVLCLEEMLGVEIDQGAIFYVASQRRRLVDMGWALRERTEQVIERIRLLLSDSELPPALNDRRCVRCSLRMACLPWVISDRRSYGQHRHYLFKP